MIVPFGFGLPGYNTNEPMNSASFLNRHRRARVRFTPKAGDPWMPVTSTGMTEESFDRLTGIRRIRGWWSALQPKARDRLGHRPGGDVSSACAEPWSLLVVVYAVVAASFSGQRNASPVISMRCRITANLRASATQAFLWLVRFLIRRAQSFSG